MKILGFKGTKVHDYLMIDVRFNPDLSIITGSNGTGKTTAILLLQALLCPNFKDLISVPFESIELSLMIKERETIISASNKNKQLVIKINSVQLPLEINREKFEELEYLNLRTKEISDPNEMALKFVGPHPVVDFIKQLPSPIFIGLERRSEVFQNEREDFVERRMYMNKSRHELNDYKRQFKGTLGVSLLETEFLVQAIYKRLRVIEDRYTADLQNEILLSSFEYITFDSKANFKNSYLEKRGLLSRRKEIEDALAKVGFSSRQNFTDKLNVFFTKLESLIDSTDHKTNGISIEWLTNQSQIDKLTKLLEIIDDYNSKVKIGFKPINKFLNIINSFFVDSGKSIYVDEVGHLFIKRPNGRDVPIDALSSGERQIVILFANVMFNKNSSEFRDNILFIDEPELSLHIKWQEQFIDKLMTASDNTQFILATHSPDIVGDHKRKCVKINNNVLNAR
jgi:predicted ATP-binding protein involved in virulence